MFWLLILVFVFLTMARREAQEKAEQAATSAALQAAKQRAAELEAARQCPKAKTESPRRKRGRPRKNPLPDPDAPRRKPGRPRKNPLPVDDQRREIISNAAQEQRRKIISNAAPASADELEYTPGEFVSRLDRPQSAPRAGLAGQTVAFTGTLPGMKRAQAIEAVKAHGGYAYDEMYASTTLLVVGDKPGKNKLDKAARWPSCLRITAAEFFRMIAA